MADKKISALTAASTPLAGTEVLPIVQSGATVKIAISDVTAGRAVSGTQFTASTGNFILGTAGKGIDFSINPSAPGMTSELLDDYETGTWTPADGSGAGLSLTVANAKYVKVGNLVMITAEINYPSTADASAAVISGLPFASSGSGTTFPWTSAAVDFSLFSYSTVLLLRTSANVGITNAQLSTNFMNFSIVYTV